MQPAKAPSRTFAKRFTERLNYHLNQALRNGLHPDPAAEPWTAFRSAVFDKFKPEGQYQELLAESAAEEWWRSRRYGHLTTAALDGEIMTQQLNASPARRTVKAFGAIAKNPAYHSGGILQHTALLRRRTDTHHLATLKGE